MYKMNDMYYNSARLQMKLEVNKVFVSQTVWIIANHPISLKYTRFINVMISRDSDPILNYDLCFVFMFHEYPALCYVGNDFVCL